MAVGLVDEESSEGQRPRTALVVRPDAPPHRVSQLALATKERAAMTHDGNRTMCDERLIDGLLAAHESTGLKRSLYFDAAVALARKNVPPFCDGFYDKGVIRCRICGRQM